ncbi:MAG TPA: hypothetical protein VM533_17095 [Fimbriiglobus sp.]|nr:hypothetical protein [Fimbriiglobus sp.]
MDNHSVGGPDDDLPDLWAVPLHEQEPPDSPPDIAPPVGDGSPTLTLFESDDPPSDVGFHPRLRRFDEAA